VSAVWKFAVAHLFFWLPIPLPELTPGTPEADQIAAEVEEVERTLETLDKDGMGQVVTEFKDDLDAVRSSITEMRSRSAQLLAATGFVAVLATLGTSLPPKLAGVVLTAVLVFLALYALVGTLWLTTQALRVRSWDQLDLVPGAHLPVLRIQQIYAKELYRVRRLLGIRLEVPVGYLRDAYWYFFATVVFFILLVIVRYLPFAHS
jgi:ABC-type multidrug transport system fused ATPase/permease subunit